MKQFVCILAVLAGFSICVNIATAEETPSENKTELRDDQQTEISKASADEDPAFDSIMKMQDWLDGFADKFGISYGKLQDGRTFYYGSAVTRVGTKDPAYPKELVMAFEKAMLDMQGQAVMELYGRQANKKILESYDDDSTNARSISFEDYEGKSQGQLEQLIDKALSFAEHKIDSLLEEEGHSKEELQNYDITERKKLFKDTIKIQSMKEAVAELSGLVPVQTRIIPAGSHVNVGVIAVISDNTRQVANDIGRQRPTYVTGRGMNIEELLPVSEEGYLNEFGLRYVFDEQGKPMLLSYGRWGVAQQSDNIARSMRKVTNAKERSQMLAEAAIANFISTSINIEQNLETQSINESELEQKANVSLAGLVEKENPEINEVQETLDVMFKNISSRSSMDMKGTSVVKRWQVKDENGILHVGSVVTWSYDQLDNAKKIIGQARDMERESHSIKQETQKESQNAKARSSRTINEINDF